MERTLDDSANRRLSLPQAFLAADVILSSLRSVVEGIVVWPRVIAANVEAELPFMATENIIMECTKAGGDRQDLHEAIRRHSMEASRAVKEEGRPNDLVDRIRSDAIFAPVHGRLDQLLEPASFTGRAPQQVEEFVAGFVDPVLDRRASSLRAQKEEVDV
jgi:adenylosuccinate lyase